MVHSFSREWKDVLHGSATMTIVREVTEGRFFHD